MTKDPTEPAPANPELEVRLKELEIRAREVYLSVELVRLGMRGTVLGTIFGGIVLVAMGIVSIFAPAITGLHLTWMVGLVSLSVAVYGGFVFYGATRVALQGAARKGEGNAP